MQNHKNNSSSTLTRLPTSLEVNLSPLQGSLLFLPKVTGVTTIAISDTPTSPTKLTFSPLNATSSQPPPNITQLDGHLPFLGLSQSFSSSPQFHHRPFLPSVTATSSKPLQQHIHIGPSLSTITATPAHQQQPHSPSSPPQTHQNDILNLLNLPTQPPLPIIFQPNSLNTSILPPLHLQVPTTTSSLPSTRSLQQQSEYQQQYELDKQSYHPLPSVTPPPIALRQAVLLHKSLSHQQPHEILSYPNSSFQFPPQQQSFLSAQLLSRSESAQQQPQPKKKFGPKPTFLPHPMINSTVLRSTGDDLEFTYMQNKIDARYIREHNEYLRKYNINPFTGVRYSVYDEIRECGYTHAQQVHNSFYTAPSLSNNNNNDNDKDNINKSFHPPHIKENVGNPPPPPTPQAGFIPYEVPTTHFNPYKSKNAKKHQIMNSYIYQNIVNPSSNNNLMDTNSNVDELNMKDVHPYQNSYNNALPTTAITAVISGPANSIANRNDSNDNSTKKEEYHHHHHHHHHYHPNKFLQIDKTTRYSPDHPAYFLTAQLSYNPASIYINGPHTIPNEPAVRVFTHPDPNQDPILMGGVFLDDIVPTVLNRSWPRQPITASDLDHLDARVEPHDTRYQRNIIKSAHSLTTLGHYTENDFAMAMQQERIKEVLVRESEALTEFSREGIDYGLISPYVRHNIRYIGTPIINMNAALNGIEEYTLSLVLEELLYRARTVMCELRSDLRAFRWREMKAAVLRLLEVSQFVGLDGLRITLSNVLKILNIILMQVEHFNTTNETSTFAKLSPSTSLNLVRWQRYMKSLQYLKYQKYDWFPTTPNPVLHPSTIYTSPTYLSRQPQYQQFITQSKHLSGPFGQLLYRQYALAQVIDTNHLNPGGYSDGAVENLIRRPLPVWLSPPLQSLLHAQFDGVVSNPFDQYSHSLHFAIAIAAHPITLRLPNIFSTTGNLYNFRGTSNLNTSKLLRDVVYAFIANPHHGNRTLIGHLSPRTTITPRSDLRNNNHGGTGGQSNLSPTTEGISKQNDLMTKKKKKVASKRTVASKIPKNIGNVPLNENGISKKSSDQNESPLTTQTGPTHKVNQKNLMASKRNEKVENNSSATHSSQSGKHQISSPTPTPTSNPKKSSPSVDKIGHKSSSPLSSSPSTSSNTPHHQLQKSPRRNQDEYSPPTLFLQPSARALATHSLQSPYFNHSLYEQQIHVILRDIQEQQSAYLYAKKHEMRLPPLYNPPMLHNLPYQYLLQLLQHPHVLYHQVIIYPQYVRYNNDGGVTIDSALLQDLFNKHLLYKQEQHNFQITCPHLPTVTPTNETLFHNLPIFGDSTDKRLREVLDLDEIETNLYQHHYFQQNITKFSLCPYKLLSKPCLCNALPLNHTMLEYLQWSRQIYENLDADENQQNNNSNKPPYLSRECVIYRLLSLNLTQVEYEFVRLRAFLDSHYAMGVRQRFDAKMEYQRTNSKGFAPIVYPLPPEKRIVFADGVNLARKRSPCQPSAVVPPFLNHSSEILSNVDSHSANNNNFNRNNYNHIGILPQQNQLFDNLRSNQFDGQHTTKSFKTSLKGSFKESMSLQNGPHTYYSYRKRKRQYYPAFGPQRGKIPPSPPFSRNLRHDAAYKAYKYGQNHITPKHTATFNRRSKQYQHFITFGRIVNDHDKSFAKLIAISRRNDKLKAGIAAARRQKLLSPTKSSSASDLITWKNTQNNAKNLGKFHPNLNNHNNDKLNPDNHDKNIPRSMISFNVANFSHFSRLQPSELGLLRFEHHDEYLTQIQHYIAIYSLKVRKLVCALTKYKAIAARYYAKCYNIDKLAWTRSIRGKYPNRSNFGSLSSTHHEGRTYNFDDNNNMDKNNHVVAGADKGHNGDQNDGSEVGSKRPSKKSSNSSPSSSCHSISYCPKNHTDRIGVASGLNSTEECETFIKSSPSFLPSLSPSSSSITPIFTSMASPTLVTKAFAHSQHTLAPYEPQKLTAMHTAHITQQLATQARMRATISFLRATIHPTRFTIAKETRCRVLSTHRKRFLKQRANLSCSNPYQYLLGSLSMTKSYLDLLVHLESQHVENLRYSTNVGQIFVERAKYLGTNPKNNRPPQISKTSLTSQKKYPTRSVFQKLKRFTKQHHLQLRLSSSLPPIPHIYLPTLQELTFFQDRSKLFHQSHYHYHVNKSIRNSPARILSTLHHESNLMKQNTAMKTLFSKSQLNSQKLQRIALLEGFDIHQLRHKHDVIQVATYCKTITTNRREQRADTVWWGNIQNIIKLVYIAMENGETPQLHYNYMLLKRKRAFERAIKRRAIKFILFYCFVKYAIKLKVQIPHDVYEIFKDVFRVVIVAEYQEKMNNSSNTKNNDNQNGKHSNAFVSTSIPLTPTSHKVGSPFFFPEHPAYVGFANTTSTTTPRTINTITTSCDDFTVPYDVFKSLTYPDPEHIIHYNISSLHNTTDHAHIPLKHICQTTSTESERSFQYYNDIIELTQQYYFNKLYKQHDENYRNDDSTGCDNIVNGTSINHAPITRKQKTLEKNNLNYRKDYYQTLSFTNFLRDPVAILDILSDINVVYAINTVLHNTTLPHPHSTPQFPMNSTHQHCNHQQQYVAISTLILPQAVANTLITAAISDAKHHAELNLQQTQRSQPGIIRNPNNKHVNNQNNTYKNINNNHDHISKYDDYNEDDNNQNERPSLSTNGECGDLIDIILFDDQSWTPRVCSLDGFDEEDDLIDELNESSTTLPSRCGYVSIPIPGDILKYKFSQPSCVTTSKMLSQWSSPYPNIGNVRDSDSDKLTKISSLSSSTSAQKQLNNHKMAKKHFYPFLFNQRNADNHGLSAIYTCFYHQSIFECNQYCALRSADLNDFLEYQYFWGKKHLFEQLSPGEHYFNSYMFKYSYDYDHTHHIHPVSNALTIQHGYIQHLMPLSNYYLGTALLFSQITTPIRISFDFEGVTPKTRHLSVVAYNDECYFPDDGKVYISSNKYGLKICLQPDQMYVLSDTNQLTNTYHDNTSHLPHSVVSGGVRYTPLAPLDQLSPCQTSMQSQSGDENIFSQQKGSIHSMLKEEMEKERNIPYFKTDSGSCGNVKVIDHSVTSIQSQNQLKSILKTSKPCLDPNNSIAEHISIIQHQSKVKFADSMNDVSRYVDPQQTRIPPNIIRPTATQPYRRHGTELSFESSHYFDPSSHCCPRCNQPQNCLMARVAVCGFCTFAIDPQWLATGSSIGNSALIQLLNNISFLKHDNVKIVHPTEIKAMNDVEYKVFHQAMDHMENISQLFGSDPKIPNHKSNINTVQDDINWNGSGDAYTDHANCGQDYIINDSNNNHNTNNDSMQNFSWNYNTRPRSTITIDTNHTHHNITLPSSLPIKHKMTIETVTSVELYAKLFTYLLTLIEKVAQVTNGGTSLLRQTIQSDASISAMAPLPASNNSNSLNNDRNPGQKNNKNHPTTQFTLPPTSITQTFFHPLDELESPVTLKSLSSRCPLSLTTHDIINPRAFSTSSEHISQINDYLHKQIQYRMKERMSELKCDVMQAALDLKQQVQEKQLENNNSTQSICLENDHIDQDSELIISLHHTLLDHLGDAPTIVNPTTSIVNNTSLSSINNDHHPDQNTPFGEIHFHLTTEQLLELKSMGFQLDFEGDYHLKLYEQPVDHTFGLPNEGNSPDDRDTIRNNSKSSSSRVTNSDNRVSHRINISDDKHQTFNTTKQVVNQVDMIDPCDSQSKRIEELLLSFTHLHGIPLPNISPRLQIVNKDVGNDLVDGLLYPSFSPDRSSAHCFEPSFATNTCGNINKQLNLPQLSHSNAVTLINDPSKGPNNNRNVASDRYRHVTYVDKRNDREVTFYFPHHTQAIQQLLTLTAPYSIDPTISAITIPSASRSPLHTDPTSHLLPNFDGNVSTSLIYYTGKNQTLCDLREQQQKNHFLDLCPSFDVNMLQNPGIENTHTDTNDLRSTNCSNNDNNNDEISSTPTMPISTSFLQSGNINDYPHHTLTTQFIPSHLQLQQTFAQCWGKPEEFPTLFNNHVEKRLYRIFDLTTGKQPLLTDDKRHLYAPHQLFGDTAPHHGDISFSRAIKYAVVSNDGNEHDSGDDHNKNCIHENNNNWIKKEIEGQKGRSCLKDNQYDFSSRGSSDSDYHYHYTNGHNNVKHFLPQNNSQNSYDFTKTSAASESSYSLSSNLTNPFRDEYSDSSSHYNHGIIDLKNQNDGTASQSRPLISSIDFLNQSKPSLAQLHFRPLVYKRYTGSLLAPYQHHEVYTTDFATTSATSSNALTSGDISSGTDYSQLVGNVVARRVGYVFTNHFNHASYWEEAKFNDSLTKANPIPSAKPFVPTKENVYRNIIATAQQTNHFMNRKRFVLIQKQWVSHELLYEYQYNSLNQQATSQKQQHPVDLKNCDKIL